MADLIETLRKDAHARLICSNGNTQLDQVLAEVDKSRADAQTIIDAADAAVIAFQAMGVADEESADRFVDLMMILLAVIAENDPEKLREMRRASVGDIARAAAVATSNIFMCRRDGNMDALTPEELDRVVAVVIQVDPKTVKEADDDAATIET